MGATLATLLRQVDPNLQVVVVERLMDLAAESTAAMNNAGTGHAANCELNYTPVNRDGSLSIDQALAINLAFERSLEFWSGLVEQGLLSDPAHFIRPVPHLSFVWGEENVAFLQHRYHRLSALPQFADMAWGRDRQELQEWMPLVMGGRSPDQPVAATRVERGTDINFGSLSRLLLEGLERRGLSLLRGWQVINLRRQTPEAPEWQVEAHNSQGAEITFQTPFVFLGAGGGALSLFELHV